MTNIDHIIARHPLGAVAFDLRRRGHRYADTAYAAAHACVTGDVECTRHDLAAALDVLLLRGDTGEERRENLSAMRASLSAVERADPTLGNLIPVADCWRWAQSTAPKMDNADRDLWAEESSFLRRMAENQARPQRKHPFDAPDDPGSHWA